ncbi:MAG: BadF/BadG/BcrA/BcrD ATPase family protein, partial [Acidobacteriota bacterium]
MNYAVGIDLGSTTTKAVVIGADAAVLGRGITNSRSNYDVACQVALNEALIDTRFSLIRQELAAMGLAPDDLARRLRAFERLFRAEQYRSQLRVLARELDRFAGRLLTGGHALRAAVGRITTAMEEDISSLFAEGSRRKSDFFRDLAGSRYVKFAETEARVTGAGFDRLVGLFDKAILDVENSAEAAGRFDAHMEAAMAASGADESRLAEPVERIAGMMLEKVGSVGTGYGRQRLPFPEGQIKSEILCHGLGAHALFPRTRTVLDIGGQDTKAIQVDDQGIV